MKSNIEGVVVCPIEKYEDDRGWLTELFRRDCLEFYHFPAMAYVSMTKPGVTRGPHEHKHQTDLFVFIGPGNFQLYLWGDKGLEVWHLGESCPAAVVVPPGVVHAYKNVSLGDGWVFNAPNQLYGGPGKRYPVDEVRHEDQDCIDGRYEVPIGCTDCNGPSMCSDIEKTTPCCPWNPATLARMGEKQVEPIPDVDPNKPSWRPMKGNILHSSRQNDFVDLSSCSITQHRTERKG